MGDVVFPYRVEDLPQSGRVPTGRIKGTLTYIEGYLVLIGGISSDGLEPCDLHVFDLAESTWLKLSLPTNPSEDGLRIQTQNGKCFGKRQGHTAVRHGHSIYLIGGCDTEAKDYFCYDDLWQLTFNFDKQKLVSIRIQDGKQHPLNLGMQQVSAVLMKKQGLNHVPVLVQATGTGRGIEPSEEGVPYYLKTVVGRNLPLCADACSGHGWCDKGYCRCEAGFQGHDCGLIVTAGLGNEAAGVCNYQGIMAPTGRCHCFHGYRGQFCQYGWARCPGDCSGHGICTHQARCDCSHGWEGLDCSVRARCPLECCNHGECSTEGKCDCFEGYFGLSCAISLTDRMGLQTAAQEAVDRLIQLAAAKDKESAEHETLAVELQAAVVGELSPVDQASREKKISDARMLSDELSQEADVIRDQSAQLLFKVQRDENLPKFFDNQNCQISLKPLIKLPGDSEAADAATLYKRQLLFSDMTSREQLNISDETFWAEQARLGGYVPPTGRTEQGQLVDDQASPRLQQTPPSSLLSVLALWLCMLATGVTWLIQSQKSRGEALIRDQEMTVYI
ncbi:MAG: uncharacterized protein KVP18_004964 [Porospora cf. gigantea A]|uniref:uncharacterized protein n=3 Tax=Porospora cf. gigantea A TaxID=2853593 RepID=UPI00355A2910|nr:MAG: hypothetical protein KVP18_004964 [Porospora cf. gigantea A]